MSKKDEKFTLNELFERYQKQPKIKNLSEYTIKYHENYFRKFKRFVDDDSSINYLIKPIEKQQLFDTLALTISKADLAERRIPPLMKTAIPLPAKKIMESEVRASLLLQKNMMASSYTR